MPTMVDDSLEKGQGFCSILVLTEESADMGTGTTDAKIGSQSDGSTCGDREDVSDAFTHCVITVDIENGGTDVPKMSQDVCGSIKTDIALTKPLRRQNSLQTGGETVQPLMNHILMLLKFDAKEKQGSERTYYDGANNRWRKCKRPNLFDSRRIVILFSILSSMGTLVLIYLTLRVRQVSEGYIRG